MQHMASFKFMQHMASSKFIAFLAVLLVFLLQMDALSALEDHDLSPALAPFYERVCDAVDCGRGKCRGNISYPFSYICECEPGWKRTPEDDDDVEDHDLLFLPCIIPKCTLNYGTCQPAPPPVPQKEVPHNISAFDPCYWIYCGEGTCNRTSTYKHICQCNPGFNNLLDIPYYPCYSNCSLGSDCASLGIKVANSETSTNSQSQATSFLPGTFHWMTILFTPLAMAALWK